MVVDQPRHPAPAEGGTAVPKGVASHRAAGPGRAPGRGVATVGYAVAGVLYVAWAAGLIWNSSTIAIDGRRYFCLFDDAMISLRYAWNLAHGAGLVWNAGERVEGCTNFLWTLVLAGPAWLLDKRQAVVAAHALGVPLMLGVATMTARATRACYPGEAARWGGLPLLGFVAALAYYPLSYWTLMGMETGLLALLLTAAVWQVARRVGDPRPRPVLGVLLGLLYLARPDASVLIGVILAWRFWTLRGCAGRWRALAVEAGTMGALAGALTLFRLGYYGSPVPNTYYLKVGGIPLGDRLDRGATFIWGFLRPALPVALLLGAGAVRRWRRNPRPALIAGLFVGALASQWWVGGDAWNYWRPFAPVMPLALTAAVAELAAFASWLHRGTGMVLLVSARMHLDAWAAARPRGAGWVRRHGRGIVAVLATSVGLAWLSLDAGAGEQAVALTRGTVGSAYFACHALAALTAAALLHRVFPHADGRPRILRSLLRVVVYVAVAIELSLAALVVSMWATHGSALAHWAAVAQQLVAADPVGLLATSPAAVPVYVVGGWWGLRLARRWEPRITDRLAALVPARLVPVADVAGAVRAALAAPDRRATMAVAAALLLAVNWKFLPESRFAVPPYSAEYNWRNVNRAVLLDAITEADATVAVFWAGTVPYFTGRRAIDCLGKSDPHVARLAPQMGDGAPPWKPGHNKYDLEYSLVQQRPTYVSAFRRGRQDVSPWGETVYERVEFWTPGGREPTDHLYLLRGSPQVRWDRLGPERPFRFSAPGAPSGYRTARSSPS